VAPLGKLERRVRMQILTREFAADRRKNTSVVGVSPS
jgi:hypothetical protein